MTKILEDQNFEKRLKKEKGDSEEQQRKEHPSIKWKHEPENQVPENPRRVKKNTGKSNENTGKCREKS